MTLRDIITARRRDAGRLQAACDGLTFSLFFARRWTDCQRGVDIQADMQAILLMMTGGLWRLQATPVSRKLSTIA